jgi:catechol-2,3-dioxygenase
LSALTFDHFNIRAPAPLLDTVRDFYLHVLGLTVGERPAVNSRGYWLYLSGQPLVHLSEWADAPDVDTLPRGHLDHVAFSCNDLEGMLEKLERLGIEYSKRSLNHRDSTITQLKVSDPTGNVIELNFTEVTET